jgi:hypothetical protein
LKNRFFRLERKFIKKAVKDNPRKIRMILSPKIKLKKLMPLQRKERKIIKIKSSPNWLIPFFPRKIFFKREKESLYK